MSVLRWEEPTPDGRGAGTDWVAIAQQLRDNPGRWAVVAVRDVDSAARTLASRLKSGRNSGWVVGDFDVVARRTESGTAVHARYVGASS